MEPGIGSNEVSKDQFIEKDKLLRPDVADLEPYLQPGIKIVNVEYPDMVFPSNRVSVVKALFKITHANKGTGVGEHGPVLASVAIEGNEDVEELHLYEVLFGRDSLRVALDLLDRYPKLAHATIVALAKLQGKRYNSRSGEEPGRIIHESRDPATDDIARELTEKRGWEWPYYESIDATPLFITTIKRYCKQEGDSLLHEEYADRDGENHTIAAYFQKSVEWLVRRLESSRRGLLESHRQMGVEPECWKDSWDSFSHHSGEIANLRDDIAPIAAEALAYDALIDAAVVYEKRLKRPDLAAPLRQRAAEMKDLIMDVFWVTDESFFGGYFCIGLDYDTHGKTRQLQIRASDMGHLLNSRLLDGNSPEIIAKREAIIQNIYSSDMLNASGVRTLATNERRFIPVGYHTGSVWLWDTYYIAQGLERHGYYGLSEELKLRIWSVTDMTNLLPEFAEGGDEIMPKLSKRIVDVWDPEGLDLVWENHHNSYVKGRTYRLEQPPQEIQAWTVAAILASKYKRDPLHPTRAVPTQAIDEKKLAFENRILSKL